MSRFCTRPSLRLHPCLLLLALLPAVHRTATAQQPESSIESKSQRSTIKASSLMSRLEAVGSEEKAALAKRSEAFGKYVAQIHSALTDQTQWFIHRGDLVIDGPFDNDLFLVVDGDLTVRGVYNDYKSSVGGLLVLGDVRAQHLLSWNAFCSVGSVYAAGLVFAYYNDWSFEVYGPRLQAQALVLFDKSSHLPDSLQVQLYDNDGEGKGNPEKLFAPSILRYADEEDEIDLAQARKRRAAGQPVFVQAPSDWDRVSAAADQDQVFAEPFSFPVDPKSASEEQLRLALLQPEAPEAVLQAALTFPALSLDLALAPAAKADLLARLADDPQPRTLRAIAAHPASSPETLTRLASHPDPSVRAAVLHHPACPPALAIQLLEDLSATVRRALAASPHATAHLDRLVADPDAGVRRTIALHSGLSLEQRRKLMADPESDVNRQALENLPVTTDLVREQAASPHPEQRVWAASQASRLEDAQELLLELRDKLSLDPDRQVREAAFQHLRPAPGFLESHADRFAVDESPRIRWTIARITRKPELLARLAQDTLPEVREGVALNLATPPDVLTGLAQRLAETEEQHKDFGMSPREQFAHRLMDNPMLPAAAFQQIDRFWPKAYNLEPHRNLPLAIYLPRLAYDDPYDPGDQEYQDRRKAESQASQPDQALAFMARSSRYDLIVLAALHAQTPPQVLLELLRTADDSMLENLAQNAYLGSGTPEANQLISGLLARQESGIDRALLGNPDLPLAVLQREAHRNPEAASEVLWARHGIEWAAPSKVP